LHPLNTSQNLLDSVSNLSGKERPKTIGVSHLPLYKWPSEID